MLHADVSGCRGLRRRHFTAVGRLFASAVVVLGAVARADAAPPSAESAEKVIADAIEAMGGADKVAKIETLRTQATIAVGMTLITTDSYWAKTGERLVKQSMSGVTITTGYDGKLGWTEHPAGVQQIDERKIGDLDDQASLHMRLLTMDKAGREQFRTIEAIDVTTFADRPCHRLRVVTTDEEPDEGHVYFDAASMLPAGWEMTTKGPKGPLTERAVLSEWKEKDGLLFFRKMEISGVGEPKLLRVTQIDINEIDTGIDANVFRAPDAVRGMATETGGAKKTLADFPPEHRPQIKQMLNGLLRMTDPDALEAALKPLEAGLVHMTAAQREAMEFIIGQARARVRELRGR